MQYLRSVAFTLIFFAGSVGAVLMAMPAAYIGPGAVHKVARGWALFHRWCAKWLIGVEGRAEGEIPIGPALIAAKHESMYETLELLALLDAPAVVVKRELANIPGWGWVARQHGVIPVDREGSASALRTMVRAARKAAAEGRAVVIFPEGTRVAPGEQPPLRAGFAGLYRGLALPVVPVAIDSGRLYPRRGLLKRRGVIRLRFGAPIPPGLPREQAEAAVHTGINAFNQ